MFGLLFAEMIKEEFLLDEEGEMLFVFLKDKEIGLVLTGEDENPKMFLRVHGEDILEVEPKCCLSCFASECIQSANSYYSFLNPGPPNPKSKWANNDK